MELKVKIVFRFVMFLFLMFCNVFALEIDSTSVVCSYTSYKLNKKIGVVGFIEDGIYEFGVTNGSVVDVLNSAKFDLDFDKQNTKDRLRDKNIYRTFNTNLDDSKIKVVFKDFNGDDSSGHGIARITFNGATKDVKVNYVVANGKLKVSGVVDMLEDFNLKKAFLALSTDRQIAALHGKKTWSDVDIYFTVNVR